jgi:hypothetical protein
LLQRRLQRVPVLCGRVPTFYYKQLAQEANSIVKYETDVKNGSLLLVAHGTADEVQRARELLHQTGAETTVHAEPVAVGA